jgi:Autotransporter beta-domain/Bacterial Ig domain
MSQRISASTEKGCFTMFVSRLLRWCLLLLTLLAATSGAFAQDRAFGFTNGGAPSVFDSGFRYLPGRVTVRADQVFAGDSLATGATVIIPTTPPMGAASPEGGGNNIRFEFTAGAIVNTRVFKLCFQPTAAVGPCDFNNVAITSELRWTFVDVRSQQCPINPNNLTTTVNSAARFAIDCRHTSEFLGPNVTIVNFRSTWSYPGIAPVTLFSNEWNFVPTLPVNNALVSVSYSFNYAHEGVQLALSGATPIGPRLTVTQSDPPVTTLSLLPAQPEYIVAQPVTLRASVQPRGNIIERVLFFQEFAGGVQEQIGAAATIEPYETTWTPTGVGVARLLAKVYVNGQLNPFDSEILQANVVDPPNPVPVVSMISPSDGQRFEPGATVILRANATDADGIARVQFFGTLNGVGQAVQIGADITNAPYEITLPNNANAGEYTVFARAIDRLNASKDSAAIRFVIAATSVTTEVTNVTNADQLRFVPNSDVRLNVRVSQTINGVAQTVPALALRWRIETAAATCAGPDTPVNGVVTAVGGLAQIEFRAGCNSAEKRVLIALDDEPQTTKATILLTGPDQSVNTIEAQSNGIYYATPGVPEPISVRLTAANLALLQGGLVSWAISSNLGSVQPAQSQINNGSASSTVTLANGVTSAFVRACIISRDLCSDIEVRSSQVEVDAVAPALTAPLLQAAIDAPRAQISLIGTRMARLRNEGGHGFSSDVNINIAGISVPQSAEQNDQNSSSSSDSDAQDDDSSSEEEDEAAAAQKASKLGVFMLGDVSVSKSDSTGGLAAKSTGLDDGYKIRSRGLTLGVDYRFDKGFVAGLAIGGAIGNSDSVGVEQDSRGYSVSAFAQWLPTDRWYLSGVLNAGRNRYDIERLLVRSNDRIQLNAKGKSNQAALVVESGYSFASGKSRFTPYARYEYINAKMGSLSETGGPGALFVDSYSSRLSTLSGGLSADFAFNTRAGVLLPGIRLEMVKENVNADPVRARLLSGGVGFLPVENAAVVDDFYGNAGINIQWLTGIKGQPISGYLGFDYQFARDNLSTRSFSIGIKIPL